MTIPQEAIEAATRALSIHWKAPHTNEALGRQRALAERALTAALPALERQIRERVTQELAAEATHYAMTYAAQIARGKGTP